MAEDDVNNKKSKKSKKDKVRPRRSDGDDEETLPPLTASGTGVVELDEPTKDGRGADEKDRKAKKRKKVKKDKWGQPVAKASEEGEDVITKESPPFVGEGELYEGKKVVVSGMPYLTTEEEIRQLFEGAGKIVQLQLSRFPDTGNFRGLAFIGFETEEAATKSLDFDGSKMANRFIRVERCRVDFERKRKHEFLGDPQKVDGCLSAYVGNLSWDVTEDDIRDFFKASEISSVRFAFDKNTGKFRGFCHVDFEDDESLEEAMKKNQVELHGRPMKISYAVSNRNP